MTSRRASTVAAFALCWLASMGCAHKEARRIAKASRALGKTVAGAHAVEVRARIVPGAAGATDVDAMLTGTAKKSWSRALARPQEVSARAVVFVEPDRPVSVVQTPAGWRFAEDPTDVYAQDTPRRALEALVRASRRGRWDVVLRLAPERYRTGLAVEDLKRAWTDGEHAAALREARDRLASHVGGPVVADAHEASLDLGEGHTARLEREGARWVIVDF